MDTDYYDACVSAGKVYISHFGVKGMHWGVRKDRVSGSDRRAAINNINAETVKFNNNLDFLRPNTVAGGSAKLLDKNDVVIKSGSELYRISATNKDPAGKLFVSTSREDNRNYTAIGGGGDFLAGQKHYPTTFESVYKTTQDLRSPSEQKRFDAMMSIVSKPVITLDDGRKITGRQYLDSLGASPSLRALDNQAYGKAVYNDFVRNVGNQNLKLGDAYFRTLRNAGYNAVVDDNDRFIASKLPLIVLNPDATIKRVEVKQLTDKDIIEAQKTFKTPNLHIQRES